MKYLIIFLFFFILNDIKAQVQSNAGLDREICLNDTLNVIGSGLNIGDTGSYQWIDVSNGKIVSTSSNLFLPISSLTPKSYQLRVEKVSNGQTYTDFDTFDLTVNSLPTFIYKGIAPFCYNQCSLELSKNYIAVGLAGYDPTVKDSALRYFQKKNPSWISGGPAGVNPYVYEVCPFNLNTQIPKSGVKDSICYDYTDPKGCYNKECKAIRIYPNPDVLLDKGEFCQKNGPVVLNRLVRRPFNKVGGIESFRCLAVPAGSGLDKDNLISVVYNTTPPDHILDIGTVSDVNSTGVYTIEYCFKDGNTGCQTCDTTNITVHQIPVIKFEQLPKFCINHTSTDLDSFVRDSAGNLLPGGGKWTCVEYMGSRDRSNPSVRLRLDSSVKQNRYFYPSSGSGQYLLKYENNSVPCLDPDSILIIVNGLPIIQIDMPDTVCANNTVQLTNIIPSGNVGSWSGIGVNGNRFNSSISPQTSFYHGPYKVKYTYQNPLTKCYNSDSGKIIIKSLPKITPQFDVIIGTSFDVEFSISDYKFIDTNTYKCLWVFGNGDSSKTFTPGRIHFNDSGLQTVIIYLNNGNCINTDTLHFTLDYRNTSINIHTISTHIYPNPTSEIVNICSDEDVIFTLYDLNGKPLLSKSFLKGEKGNISVAGFAKGIYLIKIESEFDFVWKKLIIE